MSQSDQTNSAEFEQGSEFGRGLVICLAKFSAHLENKWAEIAITRKWWDDLSPEKRAKEMEQAEQFPRGDAARRQTYIITSLTVADALHMWADGARDHFLELDRERASLAVRELADLVLQMGDVYPMHKCSWADWLRVSELWRHACVELDTMLGVPEPDWGQW